jgi:hypothetical protein
MLKCKTVGAIMLKNGVNTKSLQALEKCNMSEKAAKSNIEGIG